MEDRIISYIRDHGLDITRYIDTFRHVVPGTVCIVSIRMWMLGSCGRYEDWCKLQEILAEPGCPIRMEAVTSAPHERKRAFDRLVWKE